MGKSKYTDCLQATIVCPRGATSLSLDGCLSKLNFLKNKFNVLVWNKLDVKQHSPTKSFVY